MTIQQLREPAWAAAVAQGAARQIRPMLARVRAEPFDSPDHLFEVKWGGVRTIARVDSDGVRAHSANLRDQTWRYPELAVLPKILDAGSAVLDGEITAWGSGEAPALELLRPRLLGADGSAPNGQAVARRRGTRVVYHVFDLLELEGRSLLDCPLVERRQLLFERLRRHRAVQVADFVNNEGVEFFQAAARCGLAGIVAKEKGSVYLPGERSAAWQEIRAVQSDDFVVGGYSFGGGRRRKDVLASILLGAYRGDRLLFVGEVSVGLSDREARRLLELLLPLHATQAAFAEPPDVTRLFYWCRPELACHVRYSRWTAEGRLRFPVFVAPRPDLPPQDCLLPDL